jgi:hypothetical protein
MLVKIIERILKDWNYTDKFLKEENFEPGNIPLKGDILYIADMRYIVEERRIHLSSYTDDQYFELIVKFKSYA